MNFTIPATSKTIIQIVVISIAVSAVVTLGTLSACLIFNLNPNDKLLLAYVSLTGQLVGSLTGLLVNTRTTPGADAEMPKAVITSDKPTS